MSASVNLPLHHKVQKFSSGTGSPGWSRKEGRKTVAVWCGGEVCCRAIDCLLCCQEHLSTLANATVLQTVRAVAGNDVCADCSTSGEY